MTDMADMADMADKVKTVGTLAVRLEQQGPIPLHVELTCAPGELLALVGPSGGGKSTILRAIAGLYPARSGRITSGDTLWFDTQDGVNLSPQQRRVGMVFQAYSLFPHLSAFDNVRIALGHLPDAQRDARARELLARVHLSGLRDRRPAKLSGGEQQRVALARALAREPRVLLLDEPFSAVDQVTRRKLRMELSELSRNLSVPTILVTHDLDEACMLGRRMCILRAGRTLQHGAPNAVMQRPRNAEVARLMDVRNIFSGVIGEPGGAEKTNLMWNRQTLELPLSTDFSPGDKVTWCIPPEQVLLHRRDRGGSRGERENPVSGVIDDLLTVGGITNAVLTLQGDSGDRLHMDLPPHVVKRNRLRIGEEVSMSLLGEAIHLMPWHPLESRSRADEAR